MLPLGTLLVCYPPLLTPHSLFSLFMMIMTPNVPSWVTTLVVVGGNYYTDPVSMIEKDAKKYLYSIDPCVQLTIWFIIFIELSELVHS